MKKVRQVSIFQVVLAGLFLLASLYALNFPVSITARADLLFEDPVGNVWLVYGLAMTLLGLGIAVLAEPRDGTGAKGPLACLLTVGCTVLAFLAFTVRLQDWWIDDAGITFAYSRSLAAGSGLAAQPWMLHEEGYSSTTWMLLLSSMSLLGVDIPLAAKITGIICSAISMMICAWIIARETRSPIVLMICGTGIACAPTIVWSASGQEHALQSLILVGVVLCAYVLNNWRWPVAGLLLVFVLTRPEAPIIVITVFCAGVFLSQRAGRPLINAADAGVALVPFAAFVGLIVFRMMYFGDPMPNPYYAKSSSAGLLGILNPLGGGWDYVLSGLRDTALFLVLVFVFLLRVKPAPAWLVIATSIVIGHIIFVIWAKGDWMGQYRFLMPVLPIILLFVSLGLSGFSTFRRRMAVSIISALVLVHTSILQTAAFEARPTTPLAVVTDVGNAFSILANKLEIEDPLLAHHDAGGISYHRMIRLLDLGGLVDRTIAKNMGDREFLIHYVIEEMQPDFVFGARNFASASGFTDTEAFENAYVRLSFTDALYMNADISYVRRDRVITAQNIDLSYDETGELSLVTVSGPLNP